MKARILPGGRREIGTLNLWVAQILGRATGTTTPNVFTTLAKNRGLFRRWMFFNAALMPGGRLPRSETELVILRVAHNCGCDYEWQHHVRLGRRAKLSEQQIERVRTGPDAPGWSLRQAALLRAADELHKERCIGEDTWRTLSAELDESLLIELCMLIGNYEMLAMTLNSLRVQQDTTTR